MVWPKSVKSGWPKKFWPTSASAVQEEGRVRGVQEGPCWAKPVEASFLFKRDLCRPDVFRPMPLQANVGGGCGPEL